VTDVYARDDSCHAYAKVNTYGRLMSAIGSCSQKVKCNHVCALLVHLLHTKVVVSSPLVAPKGSLDERKKRTSKPQTIGLVRDLVSAAMKGSHCVELVEKHAAYPFPNIIYFTPDVCSLEGGGSSSFISHLQCTRNGHSAGRLGDFFGRVLFYDRWSCCGAYVCPIGSANTPPIDNRARKHKCSHGEMQIQPCEAVFYHIYPIGCEEEEEDMGDSRVPSADDPFRILVCIDSNELWMKPWAEVEGDLQVWDDQKGLGLWPGHTHAKIPEFKGIQALDDEIRNWFVADETLTPKESLKKRLQSGKTPASAHPIYGTLTHMRYLRERALAIKEDDAMDSIYLLLKFIRQNGDMLPKNSHPYFRGNFDLPIFMSSFMTQVILTAIHHEIDVTFLVDKAFKYLLHVVSFDTVTDKWYTTCRALTNTIDHHFYRIFFLQFLQLVKAEHPSFEISLWDSLVMDFSVAQLLGLKQAIHEYLGGFGWTAAQIDAFIEKIFQGCLVHWMRSVVRVSLLVCASPESSKYFKHLCASIPCMTTTERDQVWADILRMHPDLKNWVKFWHRPAIESLLCHLQAHKSVGEWLRGVLDGNAVESHNKVAKLLRAALGRMLVGWFKEDALACEQRENVERYTGQVAQRFLIVRTTARKPRTLKYTNDGRAPDTRIALGQKRSANADLPRAAKRICTTSISKSSTDTSSASSAGVVLSSSIGNGNVGSGGIPIATSTISLSTPQPISTAQSIRDTSSTCSSALESPAGGVVSSGGVVMSIGTSTAPIVTTMATTSSSSVVNSVLPQMGLGVAKRFTNMCTPLGLRSDVAITGRTGIREDDDSVATRAEQPVLGRFDLGVSQVANGSGECVVTSGPSDELDMFLTQVASNAGSSQSSTISESFSKLTKGNVISVHATKRGKVWYGILAMDVDKDEMMAKIKYLKTSKMVGIFTIGAHTATGLVEPGNLIAHSIKFTCPCNPEVHVCYSCDCDYIVVAQAELKFCEDLAQSTRPGV
jgi:hypothetical protein